MTAPPFLLDYYEAHCEAIYPQNKTVKVRASQIGITDPLLHPLNPPHPQIPTRIHIQTHKSQVVSEIPNEFGEYETFFAPYDVLVYAVGATVRWV